MAIVNISSIQGISATDDTILNGNNQSIQVVISEGGTQAAFMSYANNFTADTFVGYNIFFKNLISGEFRAVDFSNSGVQSNGISLLPVFSSDGGSIMFTSAGTNLADVTGGDGNGAYDVFIRDINSTELITVSKNAAGALGNNFSYSGQFTPDGSSVIFTSAASNLLQGTGVNDTNGYHDVFIKNLDSNLITRISTSSAGVQANNDSFVGDPFFPTSSGIGGNFISADGTKVVFTSLASNLVTGDTGSKYDVFLKDLTTGVTSRVSTGTAGTQGNQDSRGAVISQDGTKVAFVSKATNFGGYTEASSHITNDVFVKDLVTGALVLVSKMANGAPGNGDSAGVNFSADGTKLLFSSTSALLAEDTNGYSDIYLADLSSGELQLISKNLDGVILNNASTNASFSLDGKSIVFETKADNTGLPDFNGTISDVVKYVIDVPCVFGGVAANFFAGTAAAECYHGEAGEDTLFGGGGNDSLRGDADNDYIDGGAQNDLIYGGEGSDTLFGGSGNNTLYGDVGNDSMEGGDFADTLDGGDGNDAIHAKDGNDNIFGGAGYDTILGGGGSDTIDAGGFNDTVEGGDGDDSIFGSGGNDVIDGDAGSDSLNGGTGNDTIDGGDDADYILGHNGADMIFGGLGNDSIYGNNDNDKIDGGEGGDYIIGDAGNDTITGGDGVDTMSGGAGTDTFIFTATTNSTNMVWIARDTITDFVSGVDKLDLSAFAGTLVFRGMASSFTGAGNEITANQSLEPGVDHTIISLDIDGDRVSDMMFNLRGFITVSGGDFIL